MEVEGYNIERSLLSWLVRNSFVVFVLWKFVFFDVSRELNRRSICRRFTSMQI
jgi:hypothetical protein